MNKITYLCFALLLCFTVNGSPFQNNAPNDIQRVRIDFKTPTGYTRHLLLGFTPDNAATDGFDYGYDGANIENLPDDMNWMIGNNRYVIQGVGEFNTSKRYPLGVFLTNSGQVEVSLNALENFATPINVYVYDALNDSYTQINAFNYSQNLQSGIYTNRFYITFLNYNPGVNSPLSVEEFDKNHITLSHLKNSNELIVKSNSIEIETITLYDMLGKELLELKSINEKMVTIPIQNMYSSILLIGIKQGSKTTFKKIMIPQ